MAGSYKVTAPAAGFSGVVAGVAFQHGEATVTDDQTAALGYFRRRGYRVEPVGEPAAEPETTSEAQPEPQAETTKQAPAKRARRTKQEDEQ